jgi:menaquinone-specific isochorismate synthase
MMTAEYPETIQREDINKETRLFSITQKIPAISLLDLLNDPALASENPLFYWRDPYQCISYAGVGSARTITADGAKRFAMIREQISATFENASIREADIHLLPRFLGGFAFNDLPSDRMWSGFPSAMFTLPRWMVSQRDNGDTWLTLNTFNINLSHHSLLKTMDEFVLQLTAIQPIQSRIPQVSTVTPMMSPAEWDWMISAVTEHIRFGAMEKVVLARTLELSFEDALPVIHVLSQLERHYPDCYTFTIQPQRGRAFFGATPELLVEKTGFELRTAALAGSRQRGRDPLEDEVFGAELLHSAKDHHEHAVVVEEIRKSLEPYAAALEIPDSPSLLRLSNIQHLYTSIHAELMADDSVLDFVERLHPTPAMGGYPRTAALEVIANSESVARGWYASPLGWVDSNGDGVFVAAIRSAVSVENKARLYAGAGIVADSDPQTERAETALKFKPLLTALNTTL